MTKVPKQITAAAPKRTYHARDLPPHVKIHQPGDPGHRVPLSEDVPENEYRRRQQSRLSQNRGLGRLTLGVTAGAAAVPVAAIPIGRRNFRRNTEKNKKRIELLNSVGTVRKGTVHSIHTMGPKFKRSFSDRVGDAVLRHENLPEVMFTGGALAGAGVALASTHDVRTKYRRSQKDLLNAQSRARRRLKAQQVTKRGRQGPPRPTEYSPGQPLERFSAERRRRGVAGESLLYGGAAAATGAAAGGVSNAKLAGTKIGQHLLGQAEEKLKATNHPAHLQAGRAKRLGARLAKHPKKSNAAIGGLYTAAAGLGVMSRMRAHEEEGISQGIGRIKAGEAYRHTKRQTLGKSVYWPMARAALLAADNLDSPSPRLRRAAKIVNDHPGKIALGLAGVGGAGTLVATGRAGTNRKKQARELRRVSNAPVEKAFEPHRVKNILLHPRREKLGASLKQNWKEAAIGAGGVGGAGAVGSRNRERPKSTAAAAGAGAAAGQAAYYTTGFRAIARADRQKLKGQKEGHNGMSRSAQETEWRKHRKAHGHSQGKPMTLHQQREIFTNYPRKLPGWRAQRLAAHMQRGKYALAINAGTTAVGAGGAVGAARLAQRNGNQNKKVSKALYAREERLSPLRVAQFGAGAGLAAWGLGRSPILGAALARGLKMAAGRNNRDAMTALQYAMAAQGALRRGTAPAEHSLRQVRRINDAINRVPSALRPELAATAGLLLAGHARPVHTTSYRPVSMTVRPRAYGW